MAPRKPRKQLATMDGPKKTRKTMLSGADGVCAARRKNTPDPIARIRGVGLDRQRRSEQVDDPVSQPLLARTMFSQHDVESAGGGDSFKDLQFPQPHQNRVVGQQSGRVGL